MEKGQSTPRRLNPIRKAELLLRRYVATVYLALTCVLAVALFINDHSEFYDTVQGQIRRQNEQLLDQSLRLSAALGAMQSSIEVFNRTVETLNEQRFIDKMNVQVFYENIRRTDSLTNKRMDFYASRIADNRREIAAIREGKESPSKGKKRKVILREWASEQKPTQPAPQDPQH